MGKKVVIGNDHAAVELKKKIMEYLISLGYEVINVGTDKNEACDYPDYAYKACKKIVNKEVELGILICGSGIGMSVAANKVKGIRACACSDSYTARMSRVHNDSNVLCFGERVIGVETAKELVREFMQAEFAGEQHVARLEKIKAIENGTYKE